MVPSVDTRNLWELPPPKSGEELLKRVRELELLSRARALAFQQGEYRTRLRGRGLEFREARKYGDGEDVRRIDWNMTARMQEPWVREYQDEREREVILAVDVSPSMHDGFQDRTPLEYATELAASVAWSVMKSRDRLGWVFYSRQVVQAEPPRGGTAPFSRFLWNLYREALSPPGRSTETDLRSAIHHLQQLGGRRFLILFLSDFIDRDLPEDFKYLQARHEVTLVHLFDPIEAAGMDVSILARAPEGPARRALMSPGNPGALERRLDLVRSQALLHGMGHCAISVNEPVDRGIHRVFQAVRGGEVRP